ncbi:MAG: hypothetical protein WBM32_04105 [Crocosphaera sp.]|jgi:hypothetical protein
MTESRQEQYFNLIDQLMRCPNGEEPNVLTAHSELLDSGFVESLMQVATNMAHQGNQDGAKFLIHVARQLAKELGLYPEVPANS